MNPIKLVFRILQEFSLLDVDDYAKYRAEAMDWWDQIRIDKDVPEDKRDWQYHLKVKTSVWYVAVGIACLYFPLKRWLNDLVSDDFEPDTTNN
jgi:hypothetical protein